MGPVVSRVVNRFKGNKSARYEICERDVDGSETPGNERFIQRSISDVLGCNYAIPDQKTAKLAEVEIFGVQPESCYVLTATAKQLSEIIFEFGCSDPQTPIFLHRMPHYPGEVVAVNIGRSKFATIKRPTILFASSNGLGLFRGLFEETINYQHLGLITLIYNVAKPSDIHHASELTELLVVGLISDLVFIFGDPESSAGQISSDKQLVRLIKEKTLIEAQVYVSGNHQFIAAIKHLVAQLTTVNRTGNRPYWLTKWTGIVA